MNKRKIKRLYRNNKATMKIAIVLFSFLIIFFIVGTVEYNSIAPLINQ